MPSWYLRVNINTNIYSKDLTHATAWVDGLVNSSLNSNTILTQLSFNSSQIPFLSVFTSWGWQPTCLFYLSNANLSMWLWTISTHPNSNHGAPSYFLIKSKNDLILHTMWIIAWFYTSTQCKNSLLHLCHGTLDSKLLLATHLHLVPRSPFVAIFNFQTITPSHIVI
jgi:hypothetical protein